MIWYVFGITGSILAIVFGNRRSRKWATRHLKKTGKAAIRWGKKRWASHKRRRNNKFKKRREMSENRQAWKGERKVRKGSGRGPAHLCGHPTKGGKGPPCNHVTYYADCGRH